MARPLIIVSLLLSVIAAVFIIAHIGGDVGVWLVLAAIILTDIGILTGQ